MPNYYLHKHILCATMPQPKWKRICNEFLTAPRIFQVYWEDLRSKRLDLSVKYALNPRRIE